MTAAIFAPFYTSAALELANSGLWEKRLLPVGSISYEGRKIDFDQGYLQQLADAFRQRSHNQVPFQLAGSDNKHTNALGNYGGEVLNMRAGPDGLWITVKPTERAAEILRANPKLGVSARIVEDYARADGEFFPAAIQHVLGTLDPRVVGLGPWQEVTEMANGIDQVIDLSGGTWDDPSLNGAGQGNLERLFALPEAEFDALIARFEGDDDGLTDEQLNQLLGYADAGAELSMGLADDDYGDLARLDSTLAAASAREAQRQAEDAGDQRARTQGRPSQRPGFEDRMARALDRIGRGTYVSAIAGEPVRDGMAARFSAEFACGPADQNGYCLSRYHALDCIHVGAGDADEAGLLPGWLPDRIRDAVRGTAAVRAPHPPVPADIRAAVEASAHGKGMFGANPDAIRARGQANLDRQAAHPNAVAAARREAVRTGRHGLEGTRTPPPRAGHVTVTDPLTGAVLGVTAAR